MVQYTMARRYAERWRAGGVVEGACPHADSKSGMIHAAMLHDCVLFSRGDASVWAGSSAVVVL